MRLPVVVLFILFSANHVFAQNSNTSKLPPIDTTYSEPDTTPRIKRAHSPNVAACLSAVIPGAGQAFNKKYWKIPIIYAGFITGYYFNRKLNAQYKIYRNIYKSYSSGSPDTIVVMNGMGYSLGAIQQVRDYYRRYRDITIISLTVWYALNIIDASVDAYFFDYDISDKLSINLTPNLMYRGIGQPIYTGLTIVCLFKK